MFKVLIYMFLLAIGPNIAQAACSTVACRGVFLVLRGSWHVFRVVHCHFPALSLRCNLLSAKRFIEKHAAIDLFHFVKAVLCS